MNEPRESRMQFTNNSASGVKYPLSATYTSTDAEFDNTFDSDFWGSVSAGMEIPDLPDSQFYDFIIAIRKITIPIIPPVIPPIKANIPFQNTTSLVSTRWFEGISTR